MSYVPLRFRPSVVVAFILLFLGQAKGAEPSPEVVLTLPEAIELALRRSFALREAQLAREDAGEQFRTAFSGILPQLRGRMSYTRTIEAADPFAGSSAGSSFANLGAVPWLQYNEEARIDDNPNTVPLTFSDFLAQQAAAQDAASVGDRSNPFLVENGFAFGLSVSQVVYDGSVINAIKAAKANEVVNEQALDTERLAVIQEVSIAFYNALLQKQRELVLQQSVNRARRNLEDARARTEEGDLPELQRLTAEVELANRKTDALRAQAEMRNMYDRLRELIALPPNQKLSVGGKLSFSPYTLPKDSEAVSQALGQRPDLARAHTLVKVGQFATSGAVSRLLPTLRLEANLSANGQIPDNRSVIVSAATEDEPFRFEQNELGVFDDTFWYPVFNVGLRLDWTLFDGFANVSRIRRERIATRRAQVTVDRTELRVRVDVERSLRTLRITQEQVETQQSVRSLAQRNYEQTQHELQAGAATQFDLRQASQQLDESRLNYLQAIHDYEVAWVEYQVAMGQEPAY